MRTLRDGARQLQQLHKDLHPPTFARRDWKDNVYARQSLGDGHEVELWFLAEHFLLAWQDWHGLFFRFPRYFGEPEKPFPASWQRLQSDCSMLADQLLHDPRLDAIISNSWLADSLSQTDRKERFSIRQMFQSFVQNHRRWSLLHEGE